MKRPTVCVTNGAGRSLRLHLHDTIKDDGAGRAFLGRMISVPDEEIPDSVVLQEGINHGVDREFFERWLTQNSGFAVLPLITHENEE